MKSKYRATLALLLMTAMAGCATTSPTRQAELESLRADYAGTAAVPQIRRYAPVPLHDAKRAMEAADRASSTDEFNHQVYMARRYIDIAQAQTRRELARNEVVALSRERDQLMLAQQRKASAAADARARRLQAELSALETQRTDIGVKLTLDDVLFETNRAKLLKGASPTLDALAGFMRQHPQRDLLVNGFTDSRGNPDYNQELSTRRAEEVKQAIVARGVAPDRIVARGYGEAQPIASNNTAAGRQLNRRVEIIILRDGLKPE